MIFGMKKIARLIPNIITSIRIIGAISILFFEPFSLVFFIVYGLTGVTDVLDGFVARKFHLESKLGSILDSVSDIIFLGVMAFKIMPTLIEVLPFWCWIIICVPTFFHLMAYVVCAIKFKRFSAVHTYANKIMSAAIFCFPFTFIGVIPWIYQTYIIVFGTVALYASIEINLIHFVAKRYDLRNKSIFLVKRNEKDVQEDIQ